MSTPNLPVIFDESPHLVTEFNGYKLLIVHQPVRDATWPSVRVEFPDETDEEGNVTTPGGYVDNQLLLKWFDTFDSEEDPALSQRRAIAAEKERDEVKANDRALRKEIGALKRRVAELETQVARDAAEVRSDLAKVKIAALQSQVIE